MTRMTFFFWESDNYIIKWEVRKVRKRKAVKSGCGWGRFSVERREEGDRRM